MPNVKLAQILHHGEQLDAADLPNVAAATVDDEDVLCCPSLQEVRKDGDKGLSTAVALPNQQKLTSFHAEAASEGLCSSLRAMLDICSCRR